MISSGQYNYFTPGNVETPLVRRLLLVLSCSSNQTLDSLTGGSFFQSYGYGLKITFRSDRYLRVKDKTVSNPKQMFILGLGSREVEMKYRLVERWTVQGLSTRFIPLGLLRPFCVPFRGMIRFTNNNVYCLVIFV